MDNKIVIVGADHHNTLGVVESFGLKGLKTYVIAVSLHSQGYVLHSKFVIDGWCCCDEQSVINCLLTHFTDSNNKAVIVTTNDIAACIIDKNHSSLISYFHIPSVKPYGNLSTVISKENMSELARHVGLDVPKTWVVDGKQLPNDLEFPIITKAISSVEGTKDNIRVCFDNDQLKDFLSNNERCHSIQIQKFIDKEYEFQFLGCSINGGEEVLIPGRTNIIRPNGLDNTFFLSFDKCEPELSETLLKAVNFVKLTHYTGLFSIEFLHDKTSGRNYFTEMNFRNDGNAICVTKAGTNLPYIYYLSMIGGDYKNEINSSNIKKIYLVPEVYYFSRFIAGEFGFREWATNMRKANCYTTFFKNDIKPFFWFIWLAIKKRLFILNVSHNRKSLC